MKRPQIPAALSFDGCGINNASAEYCPRILTIPQAMRDDPQIKALGQAAAALPALLAALESALDLIAELNEGGAENPEENEIRDALTLAGYEF